MKIYKLEVENFRLLQNFSIDLEKGLSLVIGKNNTGKTSILTALNKFLDSSGKPKFTFDDFNIEFKKSLKQLIETEEDVLEKEYLPFRISLKIFINYFETDNLSNISQVMMDLSPDNNVIVLGFEYALNYIDYKRLKTEFFSFKATEREKKQAKDSYTPQNFYAFTSKKHSDYFKLSRKSYAFDVDNKEVIESQSIDLDIENISIRNIINFKYISAKREVTNKEFDKTLSVQTSRIYNRTEENPEQSKAVEEFKDRLTETDIELSSIYSELFDEVIKKVKNFGGVKPNESSIQIVSSLQHRELLQGNTTVVYSHDEETTLPEHFNGLGYMNLISLIFEIEILIREFKRTQDKIPADINLLFIEEPEAHTHPQMQYVFIKNIKSLLQGGIKRPDDQHRDLQYIISTHSSHIVADSDFDDIKYLKKENKNSVISKNLKDLQEEYCSDDEKKSFRFLKQYLTLNRAELFFADKAIFIEGDTEKILLPAMMKKIDQEYPESPLLSQNISIIEVGAHSHIFEKLIDFIGLTKSLIITDIDSYLRNPDLDDNGDQKKSKDGKLKFKTKKCSADHPEATHTSNGALKFFFDKKNADLSYFKELTFDSKQLRKNELGKWTASNQDSLLIVFQTKENNYHSRSFEDAFFHINKNFICSSSNSFPSITSKWLENYKSGKTDVFEFSEKSVKSKPSLAIEVLLNSKSDENNNEFSNWETPMYIKEGLLWLKKD